MKLIINYYHLPPWETSKLLFDKVRTIKQWLFLGKLYHIIINGSFHITKNVRGSLHLSNRKIKLSKDALLLNIRETKSRILKCQLLWMKDCVKYMSKGHLLFLCTIFTFIVFTSHGFCVHFTIFSFNKIIFL